MARLTNEQKIDQLDNLRLSDPNADDNADNQAVLLKAVQAKHNRLVAKAAKLCAQHYLSQYHETLKTAFHYFAQHADKDKGCFAKKAIVQSLFEMDHLDDDFYAAAIKIRQPEPVWGGSIDSAIDVRCWAALGLTLSPNSRIMFELLELLHDPEAQARLGAVKAISCIAVAQAELLLREKILDGDEDAYVIGECFHQLMTIEPDYSLQFVASYLDHSDEEWLEYAALAIAQQPTTEALQLLTAQLEQNALGLQQKHLIKAIALHRSSAAIDYLLDRLQDAGQQQALYIISALSNYRSNSEVRQLVAECIEQSQQPSLQQAFEEYWT